MALILAADFHLKSGPRTAYRPDDAMWAFFAPDLTAFWQDWDDSPLRAELQPTLAELPLSPILELRKILGVRLTPDRWGRWCGDWLAGAVAPDGWVVTLRPGLLLRGYLAISRGGAATGTGVEPEWYHEWHDGYLIVASSQTLLERSKAAPAGAVHAPGPAPELHLDYLAAEQPWRARIAVRGGVTARGFVPLRITPRTAPLTLPNVWPADPVLTLSATRAEDFWAMLDDYKLPAQINEFVTSWRGDLAGTVPDRWYTDRGEFSIGLLGVDDTGFLPVPELVALERTLEAPALPPAPSPALPFEWNGFPGLVVPWHGEKLSLHLAIDNRTRYTGSQEPLMADCVGKLRAAPLVPADIVVRLDIGRAVAVAKPILERSARHELIPRMNASDFDARVAPYLAVLAELGVLEVRGIVRGGGLECTARLDATSTGSNL